MSDSSSEAKERIFKSQLIEATKENERSTKITNPTSVKSLFIDVDLARLAWESTLQKIRVLHGAKRFRSFGFQDVGVSCVRINPNGTVTIDLQSPAPERVTSGVREYEECIKRALAEFYGREVTLKCLSEDASDSENTA